MECAELGRLELQVDDLLRVVEDLQAENKYLRNQLARQARAKSLWYQNTRRAAGKIKKIISENSQIDTVVIGFMPSDLVYEERWTYGEDVLANKYNKYS